MTGKKKAVVAIAHSILRITYFILSTDQPYVEFGPDFGAASEEARIRRLLTQVRGRVYGDEGLMTAGCERAFVAKKTPRGLGRSQTRTNSRSTPTGTRSFLPTEIRDVDKRIERIEDGLVSRTHVVGIVITSIGAAIGVVPALLAIFKALGLLH